MLRLRSSAMPLVAPGTYSDWKGTSAVPRIRKPQPARTSNNKTRAFLNDKIDEPARHDHHLLHALAGDEALHVRIGARELFDGSAVGGLRHADRAAQLAVHLHDELDLVLLQG